MDKDPSVEGLSAFNTPGRSHDAAGEEEQQIGSEPEGSVRYPSLFPTSEEHLAFLREAWNDGLGDNPLPESYFDPTWVIGSRFRRTSIQGFQGPSRNYPDTRELAWIDGRVAFLEWLKKSPSVLNHLGLARASTVTCKCQASACDCSLTKESG
jgi:hypothetical protein